MASCLALNASFEPMRLLPLKRAVRLLLQGKAEVVEADPEREIRAANLTMPRPVVIRLKKMVKVPQKFRRAVTNTFLFARDNYTCQYCGRHEKDLRDRESLNRDHVLPQSRGGPNTWTNCVTSCSTCNSRKDNRTPEEAGLVLRSTPTEPHLVYLKWKVRNLTELQAKYIRLFYGEDVFEKASRVL